MRIPRETKDRKVLRAQRSLDCKLTHEALRDIKVAIVDTGEVLEARDLTLEELQTELELPALR